jgi:hypothetical protein
MATTFNLTSHPTNQYVTPPLPFPHTNPLLILPNSIHILLPILLTHQTQDVILLRRIGGIRVRQIYNHCCFFVGIGIGIEEDRDF